MTIKFKREISYYHTMDIRKKHGLPNAQLPSTQVHNGPIAYFSILWYKIIAWNLKSFPPHQAEFSYTWGRHLVDFRICKPFAVRHCEIEPP